MDILKGRFLPGSTAIAYIRDGKLLFRRRRSSTRKAPSRKQTAELVGAGQEK